MKTSQLIPTVAAHLVAGEPLMIWGPPGIGKSDSVRQAVAMASEATGNDYGLRDVRLLQFDPVDLRGIPSVRDNLTTWAQPDFLPREGFGGLFLDEITAAPPAVAAAAYQLVLDRRLGDYVLPPGWGVIAAGNDTSHRSVAHLMPAALANRMAHVHLEVCHNDWVSWAIGAGLDVELVGFIRFRPDLLYTFDPKAKDQLAFASPRTWAKVSRALSLNLNGSEAEVIEGLVGKGPASEFLAFRRVFRSMPSLDHIIADPTNAPIPDQPATLYAVSAGLAHRCTPATVKSVATYVARMGSEWSTVTYTDAVRRQPDIMATEAGISWAATVANHIS